MNGLRILIIDDDRTFSDSIKLYMGVWNDIGIVNDCNSARTHLRVTTNNPVDAVLLDKHLPDGSGADLIPLIKLTHPKASILVLTGDDDFNSVKNCLIAGADDYIIKSQNLIPELQLRIHISIERKKTQIESVTFRDLLPKSGVEISEAHYTNYLRLAEKQYLAKSLVYVNGNVSELAGKLGISRATAFKKISELCVKKTGDN